MDSVPPTSPDAVGAAGDRIPATDESGARFAARLGRRAAPVVRTPLAASSPRGPGRLAGALDRFTGRVGLSQTARWALEASSAPTVGDVRPPISYWPWDDEPEEPSAHATPEAQSAPRPPQQPAAEPDGFVPSGDARVDQLRRLLQKRSKPEAAPAPAARRPVPDAPRRTAPRAVHRGLPQVLHRKGTASRRPRPGDMARRLEPASVDPRTVAPRPAAAGVPANLPAAAAQARAAESAPTANDGTRRSGAAASITTTTATSRGSDAVARPAIRPASVDRSLVTTTPNAEPSRARRGAVDLTAAARSLPPSPQPRPAASARVPDAPRAAAPARTRPEAPNPRADEAPGRTATNRSDYTARPPATAARVDPPQTRAADADAGSGRVDGPARAAGDDPVVAPPAVRVTSDGPDTSDGVRRTPADGRADSGRDRSAALPGVAATPAAGPREPRPPSPASGTRPAAAPQAGPARTDLDRGATSAPGTVRRTAEPPPATTAHPSAQPPSRPGLTGGSDRPAADTTAPGAARPAADTTSSGAARGPLDAHRGADQPAPGAPDRRADGSASDATTPSAGAFPGSTGRPPNPGDPAGPGSATAGLSVAPGDLRRSSAAEPTTAAVSSRGAPPQPSADSAPGRASATSTTDAARAPAAGRPTASAPTASSASAAATPWSPTPGDDGARADTPRPGSGPEGSTPAAARPSGRPPLDMPRPPAAVPADRHDRPAGHEGFADTIRRRTAADVEPAAPAAPPAVPARLGTERDRPATSRGDRNVADHSGAPWPTQRATAPESPPELGARTRGPIAADPASAAPAAPPVAGRPGAPAHPLGTAPLSTAPPLAPRLRPVEGGGATGPTAPADAGLVSRYRPTWQGDDTPPPPSAARAPQTPVVRRIVERDPTVTSITRHDTRRADATPATAADRLGTRHLDRAPGVPRLGTAPEPVAARHADSTPGGLRPGAPDSVAARPAADAPGAFRPSDLRPGTTPAGRPDAGLAAVPEAATRVPSPAGRRHPATPASSAATSAVHDLLPAPPSVRHPSGDHDTIGPAATPRPAAGADHAPAARFETVLRRTPAAPAPLPVKWRPLASAIAGERRVRVSTNAASRAALQAAGKRAATTGDVIHLARPLRGPSDAPLLAHELTHVAAPSPAPRFFDDERDSPEERRAEMIADVIRRSPVLPRPHAGASMGALAPRTPATARTTTVDASTSVSADDMVRRLTAGVSSGGSTIRRSAATPVRRWDGATRPSNAPSQGARLGGSRAAQPTPVDDVGAPGSDSPNPAQPDNTATQGTTSEPGSTGGGTQENERRSRTWPAMTGGTDSSSLRDLTDWIIEQVEERVMRELERRGGRYRGGF